MTYQNKQTDKISFFFFFLLVSLGGKRKPAKQDTDTSNQGYIIEQNYKAVLPTISSLNIHTATKTSTIN